MFQTLISYLMNFLNMRWSVDPMRHFSQTKLCLESIYCTYMGSIYCTYLENIRETYKRYLQIHSRWPPAEAAL